MQRWLRASAFEFRHRFVISSVTYFVGFFMSAFDHVNAAEALLRLVGASATRRELQLAFVFGALLVAVAAALRTWASAYLPSAVVHDTAVHGERLVADGPYRYVRNPLYLGNLLMVAGMGLLASRLGFLLLVVLQSLLFRRLIGREEAELTAAQGARYRRFCEAVPRLLPALAPRLPASGNPPAWGQAWLGEAFFWVFAAAVAGFALTLRWRVFLGLLAAGFLAYYVAVAWQRGPRRQPHSAS